MGEGQGCRGIECMGVGARGQGCRGIGCMRVGRTGQGCGCMGVGKGVRDSGLWVHGGGDKGSGWVHGGGDKGSGTQGCSKQEMP